MATYRPIYPSHHPSLTVYVPAHLPQLSLLYYWLSTVPFTPAITPPLLSTYSPIYPSHHPPVLSTYRPIYPSHHSSLTG